MYSKEYRQMDRMDVMRLKSNIIKYKYTSNFIQLLKIVIFIVFDCIHKIIGLCMIFVQIH